MRPERASESRLSVLLGKGFLCVLVSLGAPNWEMQKFYSLYMFMPRLSSKSKGEGEVWTQPRGGRPGALGEAIQRAEEAEQHLIVVPTLLELGLQRTQSLCLGCLGSQ